MILSCAMTPPSSDKPSTDSKNRAVSSEQNPLLMPWPDDHGGIPPFDRVLLRHFKPAILEAIQIQRDEINQISSNTEPPTLANTLVALEKSGQTLNQVLAVFRVWNNANSNEELQSIDAEMSPKIAELKDEIVQNQFLFRRIEALYKNRKKLTLGAEENRLLDFYYNKFVRLGARLRPTEKKRVLAINQRLAILSSEFNNKILADQESTYLTLNNLSELDGLPESLISAAANAAKEMKLENQWVIKNTRSMIEPFLTYAHRRDLRHKAFQLWTSRGDNPNSNNTHQIISKIIDLRSERSHLLKYKSYADWKLADSMAKSPAKALKLMLQVWTPALQQAQNEIAEMQALVDSEGLKINIEPWDHRYYSEKIRKAKFDYDAETIKQYLQLEKVRDAMFWMAKELYGLVFQKLYRVPVFHPSVEVYKVTDRKNQFLGLWYFDPYSRPLKRSGAWMSNYRSQSKMDDQVITTLVSNNSNFNPGKAGEPTLISWQDATTLFHEFGHALHGLLSEVTYPSLSGTETARDFVEFPSNMHENYLRAPQVLKLLTNRLGEHIPTDLIEKIADSQFFNQGFATVELLASGIVEMKLHQLDLKYDDAKDSDRQMDINSFEKKTLAELRMPKEIVMRHRLPHFSHIFADEDYAAGYYGYLWAQVLADDAFEAFSETRDLFNPRVAENFRQNILSVGDTVDPARAFKNFRGRPASVDALLRARGFPLTRKNKRDKL